MVLAWKFSAAIGYIQVKTHEEMMCIESETNTTKTANTLSITKFVWQGI